MNLYEHRPPMESIIVLGVVPAVPFDVVLFDDDFSCCFVIRPPLVFDTTFGSEANLHFIFVWKIHKRKRNRKCLMPIYVFSFGFQICAAGKADDNNYRRTADWKKAKIRNKTNEKLLS